LSLIIVEYGQLKIDIFEQLVTGKSKILIEDGNLKSKKKEIDLFEEIDLEKHDIKPPEHLQ
jgi:uncharacterized membrane protein YcaP (DUF421 family)